MTTDAGTYALMVGLLLSAAPLTIATRVAALLRLEVTRWVTRVYVTTLVVVVGVDVLLFGSEPLAAVVDPRAAVSGVVAGLVAIPIVWVIDRAILHSARELSRGLARRARLLARTPSRGRGQRVDNPALVALGGGLEELLYRFYLPGLVTVVLGSAAGVGLALVLYALIHGAYGWWQVLAKGVLGAFFLLLFAVTGTLIAPCIAHAGFNLLATTGLSVRTRTPTRVRSDAKVEVR
jgi:hypothetical protein